MIQSKKLYPVVTASGKRKGIEILRTHSTDAGARPTPRRRPWCYKKSIAPTTARHKKNPGIPPV